MSEIVTKIDPIKEEYQHRYDIADPQRQLADDYPSFPGRDFIEAEVRESTSFPLAMGEAYEAYPSVAETPISFQSRLEPTVLRASFEGSDEELEEAVNHRVNSHYGVQITDPRLHLPDEVQSTLVSEAQEHAIKSQTASSANEGAWWLNRQWKVDDDIAEGRLSEAYDFTFGDNKIQLINLDKPLEPEALENIRIVLEKIALATEGRVFSRLNTILLQHNDRFRPGVWGEAMNVSGVFRLNTAIVELNHIVEKLDVDGNVEGYTYYQKTLAHEIGHLMDISDLTDDEAFEKLRELGDDETTTTHHRSAFGPLLGWRHRKYGITDEDGTKQHTIKGIQAPPTHTLVMQDGKPVKVNTAEHFGQDVIDGAVPVSGYGNSNEEEDFGEAFAHYVLGGKESVDPLRGAAITLTLSSLIMAQAVDLPTGESMKVESLALTDIKPFIKVPKTRPLAIFIQTNWTKAPDFMLIGNFHSDDDLAKMGYYR